MLGRQPAAASPKKPRAPYPKRASATAHASPRAVAKPSHEGRDNQERPAAGVHRSAMEPFKMNPIAEVTQPNKYRRKRTDLQPLAAVHPIIQTSLEADLLDQRLCSIKQQIDHVLLGGHLAEPPPLAPPALVAEARPVTTAASPVSLKSAPLPAADAAGREILQAQRYLCADAEVDKWLQSYEADKDSFTSFALFTEHKLDQLANFTAEAGRPNVIETAACFAALYKMPGILGNYRSLLQKIVVGLEHSIYGSALGDEASGASFRPPPPPAPGAIADVVRSFYRRKPFFVQLRELEHDQRLTTHLGLPRRVSARALSDADKARVLELCAPELLERALLRLPEDTRAVIAARLCPPAAPASARPREATDETAETVFDALGAAGEARLLEQILLRDERQLGAVRDALALVTDPRALVRMFFCASAATRAGFFEVALGARHESEFLAALGSALTPEQRRALAGPAAAAGPLTPRQLHDLFSALAAYPTPFAPLEQKALFHDVVSLLTAWKVSDKVSLEHFVVDAVHGVVSPGEKRRLLKALLRGDPDGARSIVADYLGSLSLAERAALEAPGVFLLEPFKKQVAAMTTEMRLNVVHAAMLALTQDLEAQGVAIDASTPAKTIARHCRELFGLAVGPAPAPARPSVAAPAPAPEPAKVVPETPAAAAAAATAEVRTAEAPTVAVTLEVLQQMDVEARAAILQALAASMPPPAEAAPSLEMQLVSAMDEEDATAMLRRAMHGASRRTFETVVSNVVATFAATGQAARLDDIVGQAFGGLSDTTPGATPPAQRRLLACREAAERRRASATPSTSRGLRRHSDSTLHEKLLRALPEGSASVATQTDDGDEDPGAAPAIDDDDDDRVQPRKAPLTVAALLKKSRNKKKLDRSIVPNAFASLVTSWKINTDQLAQYCKKPLGVVLRLIADVYAEKLFRRKRETKPAKANALSRICYQNLLHAYGLPSIADMHLIALGCALDLYRADCLRVDTFCSFVYREAPAADLAHYLACLEALLEDDDEARKGRARLNVPDRPDWDVPLDRALDVAQHCLRSMRPGAVAAFCERLPAARAKSPRDGDDGLVVNADVLLGLVVAEWREEQRRREAHLKAAFRAGDNNGDGVLSFAEFQRIVLSIDKRLEEGDALLLFSETLRRTGSDAIDADTFLSVAKENGLDERAWDADEDLAAVVNSRDDLDQMWPTLRPFFVGSVEALARDCPETHPLRTCRGAGCGCLKCLVEGYAGFQAMRGAAADAPLVWKRFWHLMSQLYEAMEQSDGVRTPWAGASCIRSLPAPPLAPRTMPARRGALPSLLLPDVARISGKTDVGVEYFTEKEVLASMAHVLR
ncbi:hypothetical protein ACHHYP_04473 [Achlya hypogyna]|uniref:EF-hand domain-containing protein n=1 Tax=Achlya hypogyna TaxID=1202772 RepID=A0A1V9Z0Z9_ACHHY|nr:hypothetical protein ACHHYP_04473 [Achlya hypogyna]